MSGVLDVIIIGAGSAGLSALRVVRRHTARFVIINDGPYGTVCARVGCMPSKLLIEAANAFHGRHRFAEFGLRGAEAVSADLPAVLKRLRRLRDQFVSSTVRVTEELGDRSIQGHARLRGPNTVEVNGRVLEARKIIIATGSRPVVPEPWQSLGKRLLTTDSLFEQADLPARIAVIGAGAVGVEIAQALSRLGIQVHVFARDDSLAGLSDPRVTDELRTNLQEEMTLHLRTEAGLSCRDDGVLIRAGDQEIEVERVIAAVGRRPNLENLGLETLGVELDEQGLPPFDPRTAQIAGLPVFIAGDANGHIPLLHEAADEGYIAGNNAVSAEPDCFQRRVPLTIVFCDPGVAVIGKPFGELDAVDTLVGEVNFAKQGRARMAQHNQGVLRIYASATDALLLGAEVCAPAAEHMAHLLALAITRRLSVHEMLAMPIYHPVLEEGLRTALRELAAQLPGSQRPDLANCDNFQIAALD